MACSVKRLARSNRVVNARGQIRVPARRPWLVHGEVRAIGGESADSGRFGPDIRGVAGCGLESLTSPESRKNIEKILVETPRLESPDESAMTRTILQTSYDRLPIALSVALL